MSKTNSNNTSVCNGDSKSKSSRKPKSNKVINEKRNRPDKLVKNSKSSKPHKSHRRDKIDGSRTDGKREKRSREKERKSKRCEDKYVEEREHGENGLSGKK